MGQNYIQIVRSSGIRRGTAFAAIIALANPALVRAGDIIPPKVLMTTPSGVNIADASYAYTETDLSLGPLKLERFLITGPLKARYPLIGTNMTHNFDIYVASNYTPASFPKEFGGSGSPATIYPVVHIGPSASGQYSQSPGNLTSVAANNQDGDRSGTLAFAGGTTWTSGHYVYTDREGVVYTFTNVVSRAGYTSQSERVSQIEFPDGRVQTFTYNSAQQLKLVSDTSGYAVVFDYNAQGETGDACIFNLSQTYVSSSMTCDGAPLKVSYGYDSDKNLTSVVGVDQKTTNFPGNTSNSITCIKPPGYTSCKVTIAYNHSSFGASTTLTLLNAGTWYVGGSQPETINDPEYTAVTDGDSIASFTDPAGYTTSFTYTKSTPRTMTDPKGRTTTYVFVGGLPYLFTGSPVYHEGTMLIEADMPEGNKYLAEYNGPFFSLTKETLVAKSSSGLPDLVKQYGYSCAGFVLNGACTKPVWIKDAKGNQTDYTYASFGGVTSEMMPAPATNAPRPLKLSTYVQKYAYVLNASGTMVVSGAQIWVPDTVTECQTVAGSGNGTAACDTTAPKRVTTFQYGNDGAANNLLVRGTTVTADVNGTSTSYRTCFGYDARGRKISTTTPRAGLPVCPQ